MCDRAAATTLRDAASALAFKVMSDADRNPLKGEMTLRMPHQKLPPQRLDRLSSGPG
jgi:hypothetical protein